LKLSYNLFNFEETRKAFSLFLFFFYIVHATTTKKTLQAYKTGKCCLRDKSNKAYKENTEGRNRNISAGNSEKKKQPL
jgi:hypothetical protein